jgi:hypothetical protein
MAVVLSWRQGKSLSLEFGLELVHVVLEVDQEQRLRQQHLFHLIKFLRLGDPSTLPTGKDSDVHGLQLQHLPVS